MDQKEGDPITALLLGGGEQDPMAGMTEKRIVEEEEELGIEVADETAHQISHGNFLYSLRFLAKGSNFFQG